MKTFIKIIYIVLVGFCINQVQSQNTDRSTIIANLEFFYYDNPSNSTYLGVDNQQVSNGTESGAFWTNSNTTSLRAFVRALLKDPSNGGDASLQYYTAKLLRINNRKIAVYLWNDQTAFTASSVPSTVHNPRPDGTGYVWPHASHWTRAQEPNWGGYMDMGIHYIGIHGTPWLKETFLHELMHAEDQTNSLAFPFNVDGHWYHYGNDGAHFYTEAVPSKRFAYMEAIAHVAAFYYNYSQFQQHFNWFNRNGDMRVERNAPPQWRRWLSQLFGYDGHVWLHDEIREATGSSGRRLNNQYSVYKIQDLPGKFIVHNETVMAMMMTMTSMHVAEMDPFIWAVKTFNTRIAANQGQDPLALFVKVFSEGMLQNGETINAIKQELDARNYTAASVDTPYTFILPLAYSDYFTGYTSTTKDAFKALFNNEMDTDLIDIYWDHFKDRVRHSVSIRSSRSLTDMTTIAMQCGVNQSYLPGTSGRVYEGN